MHHKFWIPGRFEPHPHFKKKEENPLSFFSEVTYSNSPVAEN